VSGNYQALSKRWQIAHFATISGAFLIAVLTHVMGIFALVSSSLYMLWKRRWLPLLTITITFFVVLMPPLIFAGSQAAKEPPVMVYYTNYLQAASSTAQYGHGVFQFVAKNMVRAFTELPNLTVQLLKLVPLGTPTALAAMPIYAAFWCLLIAGIGSELWHRHRYQLLAIWITVYGMAHLLWPHGVGLRRTLVMLPFVVYYLFVGTRFYWHAIKRLVPRALFVRGRMACMVLLAVILLTGDLRESWLYAGTFAPRVPPPAEAPANYTEASEFGEAYDWIRSNTNISDVLVWNNDPGAFLWTGRKAIIACLGESWGVLAHPESYIKSEDLLVSMRIAHGNYLVIDPISVGGAAAFAQLAHAVEQLQTERKGLLKPVFETKYGLVTIFKIDQSLLLQ
jgi:hypothetical protein